MPQEFIETVTDGVRKLVEENEKLRQRVEDLLIQQGPLETQVSSLKQENDRMKATEKALEGFIKAAKEITGRKDDDPTSVYFSVNTSEKAIVELTSQVTAKIMGLDYAVKNAKDDVARLQKQRDGYYDNLRAIRNVIESVQGETLNWKISVTDWLKDELPKLYKAAKQNSAAHAEEVEKLKSSLREENARLRAELQYTGSEVEALNAALDGVAEALREAAEMIDNRDEEVLEAEVVEEEIDSVDYTDYGDDY